LLSFTRLTGQTFPVHKLLAIIVKNVHIKIGSQTITWDVCTAPLRDAVILGLDFLEAHKAVISLELQLLLVYHSERHSSGDACQKCALPSLQFPLF
jgi:hypothetical protein